MIVPEPKLSPCKSTKSKIALNNDTDDSLEEDKDNCNDSQSDIENKIHDKNNHDSDDENIDMDVNSNKREKVLKTAWCAIISPTEKTKVAVEFCLIAYKVR